MRIPIILALFSMLFLGCNKETVNFHVKIINPATGQGYANHKFYIKSSRTGGNGENVKTRHSGMTNENGEAIVTLKVNKDTWFLTCAAVPNTCYINNPKQHYSNRVDLNPEFVFEIAPCGNLRVHFNNQNCQGPNDTLEFYYVSAQVPFGVPGVPTILTGCVNILDDPISFPMGQRNYMWKVIRNGNEQTFEGSVYVEPNSTSILEVFY